MFQKFGYLVKLLYESSSQFFFQKKIYIENWFCVECFVYITNKFLKIHIFYSCTYIYVLYAGKMSR